MSVDTTDLVVALANAVRRVRTPEGSTLYGLPIGAVITKDAYLKARQSLKDQGLDRTATKAKLKAAAKTERPQATAQGDEGAAGGAGTALGTGAPSSGTKGSVPPVDGPSVPFVYKGKPYPVEPDAEVYASTVTDVVYTYSPDSDVLRAFTKDGQIFIPDSIKSAVKKRIEATDKGEPETNFEEQGSVAKAFIDSSKPGTSIDLKPIGGDYKTYTKDADGAWTNSTTGHTIGTEEWLKAKIQVGQFQNIQEPGTKKEAGQDAGQDAALEAAKAAPPGSVLAGSDGTPFFTKDSEGKWRGQSGDDKEYPDETIATVLNSNANVKIIQEPEGPAEGKTKLPQHLQDQRDAAAKAKRAKMVEEAPVGAKVTTNAGATYTKQDDGKWKGPGSGTPLDTAGMATLWDQGHLKGGIKEPDSKEPKGPDQAGGLSFKAATKAVDVAPPGAVAVGKTSQNKYVKTKSGNWENQTYPEASPMTPEEMAEGVSGGWISSPEPKNASDLLKSSPPGSFFTNAAGVKITKQPDGSWTSSSGEIPSGVLVSQIYAGAKVTPPTKDRWDKALESAKAAPVGSTLELDGDTYTKKSDNSWVNSDKEHLDDEAVGEWLAAGKSVKAPSEGAPELSLGQKEGIKEAEAAPVGTKVVGPGSGDTFTKTAEDTWTGPSDSTPATNEQVGKWLYTGQSLTKPSAGPDMSQPGVASAAVYDAPSGSSITFEGTTYVKTEFGHWTQPGGGAGSLSPGVAAKALQEGTATLDTSAAEKVDAAPVGAIVVNPLTGANHKKTVDGLWKKIGGGPASTASKEKVATWVGAGQTEIKSATGGPLEPPKPAVTNAEAQAAGPLTYAQALESVKGAPAGSFVFGKHSKNKYVKDAQGKWAVEGADWADMHQDDIAGMVSTGQALNPPEGGAPAAPSKPLTHAEALEALEAAPEGSFVSKGPKTKYVKNAQGKWILDGTSSFEMQPSDVASVVAAGKKPINPPGTPDPYSFEGATKAVADAPVGSSVVNPVSKSTFVKGADGTWSDLHASAPPSSIVAWAQSGGVKPPKDPSALDDKTALKAVEDAPIGTTITAPEGGVYTKQTSVVWTTVTKGGQHYTAYAPAIASMLQKGQKFESPEPPQAAAPEANDPVAQVLGSPKGTKVTNPYTGTTFTNQGTGYWKGETGGLMPESKVVEWVESGEALTPPTAAQAGPGGTTLEKVEAAPVGSFVIGKNTGIKYLKKDDGSWVSEGNGTVAYPPAQVAKFIDNGSALTLPEGAAAEPDKYVPGTVPASKKEIEDALIGTRISVGNTLVFVMQADGSWQREDHPASTVTSNALWTAVQTSQGIKWLPPQGGSEAAQPSGAPAAPSAPAAKPTTIPLGELEAAPPGSVIKGKKSGITITKMHNGAWKTPSGDTYYTSDLVGYGKEFDWEHKPELAPMEVGQQVNNVTDADAAEVGSQIKIGSYVYTKNDDMEWTYTGAYYGKSSTSLLNGNNTGKMPEWAKIVPPDTTPSVPSPGKQISKKEMRNAPVGSVVYRGSFYRKMDTGKWVSESNGNEYDYSDIWQSYGTKWVNADDLKVEPGRPVLTKKSLVDAASGTVITSQVAKSPGVYMKRSNGTWDRIDKPGPSAISSTSFNAGSIDSPNWKWTFIPGQGKKVVKPNGTVTTAPDPDQKIAPAPQYQVIAPVEGGKAALSPGGPEFTVEELNQAIETLENAKGIMVKQPLAKVGNPLADTDYKALAKAHDPNQMTKQAFTALLKKKRDELVNGVPLQEIDKANTSGKASLEPDGPEFTVQELDQAIEALENAKGIMVKQPLEKVGNPIAGTPYKALAGAHDPTVGTKVAFIDLLKKKREEAVAKSLGTSDQIPEPGAPNPSGVKPGVYESAGKINGEPAYIVVHGDGTGTMHTPGGGKTSIDAAKAADLVSKPGNKFVGDTLPGKPFSDLAKTGTPPKTTVAAAKKLKKFETFPPGAYATGSGEISVTITPDGAWHFKTGGSSDWFEIEDENKAWVTAHMQAKFLQGDLMDEFGNSVAPYGHTGSVRFFGAKISIPELAEIEDDIKSGKSIKEVLQDKLPEVFETGTGTLDPALNDAGLGPKVEAALENLLLATRKDKPLGKAAEAFDFNAQAEADLPLGVREALPDFSGSYSPSYAFSTMSASELAKIQKAAQAAFGPSVGQHWTAMSIEDRRRWSEALVNGDFALMFEFEENGAKSKGVAHASGYQHPGHPANKDTHKITWAAAVPGELPAGTKPEGTWNAFKNMSPEEIDNYLIKASMANPEYLTADQRREWVKLHLAGDRFALDKMSLQAKASFDHGKTPVQEAPVWTDNVEPVKAYKPLLDNYKFPPSLPSDALDDWWDDHAGTLSEEWKQEIASNYGYGGSSVASVFGGDAAATSHWAKSSAYTKWISQQKADYEEELAKPVYSLSSHKIKQATHQIIPLVDQFGREYVFKPVKPGQEYRAEAELLGHELGHLWGFGTAKATLTTYEGKVGLIQDRFMDTTDLKGMDYSTLTEGQVAGVAVEHVLDWMLDNDDSHEQNILIKANGQVVGIDKGRTYKHFGAWAGLSGDHKANSNAPLAYTELYKAIKSGKINKDAADAAYTAVMRKAGAIKRGNTEHLRSVLEEGLKNRADFLKSMGAYGAKETDTAKLIDGILARREALDTDLQGMWAKVYKDAGLGDLPEIKDDKIGSGFVGLSNADFLEEVPLTKHSGKSTFLNLGQPGAHALVWHERDKNSDDLHVMGHFQMGRVVQKPVIQRLAAEAGGVVPAGPAPTLQGNSELAKVRYDASAAGARFQNNTETEEDKEKVEALRTSITSLDTALAELTPDKVSAASVVEDGVEVYQLSEAAGGWTVEVEHLDNYRAMFDFYREKMGKTLQRIDERKYVSAGASTPYEPFMPTKGASSWTNPTTGESGKKILAGGQPLWVVSTPTASKIVSEADVPWAGGASGWTEVPDPGAGKTSGYTVTLGTAGSLSWQGAIDSSGYLKRSKLEPNEDKPWPGDHAKSQAGTAYKVTLDSGEIIEIRDRSDTNTRISQSGAVNFQLAGGPDQAQASMQRVEAFLSTLGLDMTPAPATPEAAELRYWREFANTVTTRHHEVGSKGETLRDALMVAAKEQDSSAATQEAVEHLAQKFKGNEGAELAFYRDAFSKYLTAKQFAKVVNEDMYLPKFDHGQPLTPLQETGVPVYYRADIDLADLQNQGKWLGQHSGHGDALMELMIESGGGSLSQESRLRNIGLYIPQGAESMSPTQDQQKGGANFVYTRVTEGSLGSPTVLYSTEAMARMTTFSFSGDLYGELALREGQAPFDPKEAIKFKGSTNETMIEEKATFLDLMEMFFFDSAVKRDKAIKRLKSLGIVELRGLPIEERLVLKSNKSDALKKLKEKQKLEAQQAAQAAA